MRALARWEVLLLVILGALVWTGSRMSAVFLTGQNFWDNNPIWLAQHASGLDALRIWLDAGSDDIWLPNIEAVRSAIAGEGLQLEYHEFPGPHEAEYWIAHVPDYLRFYSAAFAS